MSDKKGKNKDLANIWKKYIDPPRIAIRHPIRTFRYLSRTFKWAWQRTVRGYAGIDLWDMDNYLLAVLPAMIDSFADNLTGYPEVLWPSSDGGKSKNEEDCIRFRNGEEWRAYLREMAQHFRNADEAQSSQQNEYSDHVFSDMQSEEWKKYVERENELDEFRAKELHHALVMLETSFHHLWD